MADLAARAQGDTFWWRVEVDGSCHEKVTSYGKWLRALSRGAHAIDRACERIYQVPTVRPSSPASMALQGAGVAASRLNVAKSVIDTVVARIGKRRPMPSFAIDDADWSLKQRAKKYRKWLIGKMSETDFDRLSPLALRDACIGRAGLTAIFAGDEDVIAERVFGNELLVDPREAQYGRPWQMMRVRRIARDWLCDRYPEAKGFIEAAPVSARSEWESSDDEDSSRTLDLSDYVDVYEAWRLPSCQPDDDADKDPLAHDGRHVLCLETGTLLCEEWTRPRFPFAVMRYDSATRGWWGRGLIRGGLADIQGQINQIVRDIAQNLAVAGKLIVFEQEQFASSIEGLTGVRPFRMKYKGMQPPQFHVPEPVSSGQVQMLEFFMKQAYDLPGTSQAMATSRSSLGLNASGVALDTQYDIESERLASQEANYANYRLDAAQCYLDAAQDLARGREDAKGKRRSSVLIARYQNGGRMEKLDFADVKLEDGTYCLRLEPVNFLPDTRAGKLSAVQELSKAGIIPQWMTGALFDEPDLARANKVLFADFHNLERIMEGLADVDVDMATLMPEPFHNLDMADIMGRAYYNAAQAEGAPEEVLERYRMWIDELKALIDKKKLQDAQNAAPPPGAAPPMDPSMMGPPGGPPVPGVPAAPGMPMPPPPIAS
jgi:hypothetical protein